MIATSCRCPSYAGACRDHGSDGLAAALKPRFADSRSGTRVASSGGRRESGGNRRVAAGAANRGNGTLGLGRRAADILIAVDQGEELFGTDGRREAEALSTLLGSVLGVDATRIGPLVRVEDPQSGPTGKRITVYWW